MSLANALAAAPAARAIVLLGDPQQLDQPTQGSHPPGAERSALGHILRDRATIEPSEGLFLEQTWRLHPEICDYTSTAFYDGRLETIEGLDRQVVDGPPGHRLTGTGVRYIPVEHHDNATESSGGGRGDRRPRVVAGRRRHHVDRPPRPAAPDHARRHRHRGAVQRPRRRDLQGIRRRRPARGLRRDRRQVPGPGAPHQHLRDGDLGARGRAARHGVPVLAQPAQRGDVTGALRDGRGLLPRPAARRLQHASPDAAGERPVPGGRGRRWQRDRGRSPQPDAPDISWRTHDRRRPHPRRPATARVADPVPRCSPGSRSAAPGTSPRSPSPRSSPGTCWARRRSPAHPGATVVLGAALGAVAARPR